MNIFELFGTIAINNRDANSALTDTAEKAERTGDRIQKAFKNVGAASIKIGKAVMTGGAAIAAAFTATVEGTREYRTAMAQLDTAFVTNGFSSEAALETYKALQAVLGDTGQTVEAVTALALMCETEEELAKWVEICTGVFAVMQGKLPIEGLTEAANETAKVGTVTGNLADALNWVGISEEDFNKQLQACLTTEERQALIMDTLYNSYRAAGAQYKDTAENVMKANEAQDNLNAAIGKLADIGEPIMTGIKNKIADMVNAAVPHIESIVTSFANFGTTWRNEVWPAIQKDWKTNFNIDLPDWDTFKANVLTKWEQIKTEIGNSFIVQAIIDIPKNYSQLATDIAKGWDETVLPAIKDFFKVTFGVDMPTWADISTSIASGWEDTIIPAIKDFFKVMFGVDMPTWADISASIASGWDNTIVPAINDFFKVTFGVDMPSWSEITSNIHAGWQSVLSTIGGWFNVDFGINPTVSGSFGGGTSEGTGGGRSIPGPDMSGAIGLDRVPRDGYLIRAHKDETLLDKTDADIWRGGGTSKIESLLAQLVANTMGGQMVVLDTGAVVGQLAPAMDTRLGTISNRRGRGN